LLNIGAPVRSLLSEQRRSFADALHAGVKGKGGATRLDELPGSFA
jgi:hypothetical protein